jgi:arabinogalactan oligomer/maltooligosaccharide transport system permease protein
VSQASLARAAGRPTARALAGRLTPYLLIAPVLAILAVLLAYPLVVGFYTSMTNLRIGRWDSAQFVGLDNYVRVLSSGEFFAALQVTFTFGAMCIAAEMPLGLGLALLLNREIRGIGAYRAICLIPIMVPNIVSALVWRSMLDPTGVINHILAPLGFMNFTWLADPNTVLFGLLLIDIWMMTPQVVILLLAALQGIPAEIYEAATVDGASAWQRFRYVTLPGLRSVSSTVVLLGIIWTFNQFAVIFLLFGPTSAPDAQILVTWAYFLGFGQQPRDFAQSAAYGILLLAILIVFTSFYRRWLNRNEQQLAI